MHAAHVIHLDTYVQTYLGLPSIFCGGGAGYTRLLSPVGGKGEARVFGVSLDLACEVLPVLSSE